MTQPPQWGNGGSSHPYGEGWAEAEPTTRLVGLGKVQSSHMSTQQPQSFPPPHLPPPLMTSVPPAYPYPVSPVKGANPAVWVIVALLAALVLGLAGYIGIQSQIVDDSAGSGPSTSTSTVVVPAPGGPVPAAGASGPAPATGESVPAYSTRCPSVFPSTDLPISAVGSTVTSCEFAEEVRTNYLRQGVRDRVVRIDAYSPVTGRSYTMTCSGNTVVTCTGGNDAVVYLY